LYIAIQHVVKQESEAPEKHLQVILEVGDVVDVLVPV
jgi:hypothetical protein